MVKLPLYAVEHLYKGTLKSDITLTTKSPEKDL